MHAALNLDQETLADFCERHHIRRLSLFGSRLKGTAQPDSDIDFLVEFAPEYLPGLLVMASMEIELSEMLGGPEGRSAHGGYFRDEVLRTAEVQYARS